MKIGIISVSDKRHMPMVSMFTFFFDKANIHYDIVRTSRYENSCGTNILNHNNGKEYTFSFCQSTSVSKIKKLPKFLAFRRIALRIIKEQKYDFLIVWNENTGLLLSGILATQYRGKYCLCVRDEYRNPMLRAWLDFVMSKSKFWTAPSPMSFHYKADYKKLLVFNRDYKLQELCTKKCSLREKDEPLRITFMGLYHRAPDTFLKMCDVFCNDKRYILQFFGDGFDTTLQQYAEMIGMHNIVTGGAFPYEKTAEYLAETDIINNYYNNGKVKVAAGIKESYTPMLYIPAIVDDGTFWGDISKKYGFSCLVKPELLYRLPNDLYQWYHQLDFKTFQQGCDAFNIEIDKTNSLLFAMIEESIGA